MKNLLQVLSLSCALAPWRSIRSYTIANADRKNEKVMHDLFAHL